MNTSRTVLLATALLASGVASAVPLFREPVPVYLGARYGEGGDLVAADFNGDGGRDLVTVYQDNRLVVATSNGFGPFAAPVTTSITNAVTRVAAGDVNGDGKTDAVYTRADLGLFVALGQGNGTFLAGTSGDSAPAPGAVALADVNGDRKLDAITVSASYNHLRRLSLAFHAGDGAGSFATPVETSLTTPATDLAVGDVNGDGRADVVLRTSSGAHAFLGGTNGFTDAGLVPDSGSGPLALGRLNADNVLDLVVGEGLAFAAYSGNGNGTFTRMATYAVPSAVQAISIASMTGDQVNDVVVLGTAAVAVFRGLGTAAFAGPLLSGGGSDGRLVVADFDADVILDAVTLSRSDGRAAFLKGNGDGTFATGRLFMPAAPLSSAAGSAPGAVADVDNDGSLDTVSLVPGAGSFAWQLAVMRGDRSGALAPGSIMPTLNDALSVTTGRVNADAHVDAVVVAHGAARTYLGTGTGTFTAGPSTAVAANALTPRALLADVTGDGKLDLAIAGNYYAGDGAGGFAAAQAAGTDMRLAGDIDRNGTLDVTGVDAAGLSVALKPVDGRASFTKRILDPNREPRALADLNGDTFLDILAVTPNSGQVHFYAGRGDGSFAASVTMMVAFVPLDGNASIGDFDDDGHADAAFGTVVLLGDGTGRFRDLIVASGSPHSAAGDFDGDGRTDLASFEGNTVRLLRSTALPAAVRTTTTEVWSASPASEYAVPVVFSSAVTAGYVPLTGSVLFTASGVPQILRPLDEPMDDPFVWTAALSHALPAGTHTVVATYTGDQSYLPSSASLQQVVAKAETEVVTSAPATTVYGDTFTVAAELRAPRVSYLPGPSRTALRIRAGDLVLTPVNAGATEVTVKGANAGTWPLYVEFLGDANYKASQAVTSKVISKRAATISVAISPEGTARMAGPVTFNVSIPGGSYGRASGTIHVTRDGKTAGSFNLTDASGQFSTSLAAGTYSFTFAYGGDGNHEPATQTVDVPVYAPAGTPIAVDASVRNGSTVVRWTPLAGASSYVLYRRTAHAQAWTAIPLWTSSFSEAIPANTTWMYAVAARDAAGTLGAMSAPDLATSVAFTDEVVSRGMRIKALHVTQLRTAVNAVRAYAGLAPVSFTDTTPVFVKAVHLDELRTGLSQARSAIGRPVTFTDPVLTARTSVIRAVHIEELRNGTR